MRPFPYVRQAFQAHVSDIHRIRRTRSHSKPTGIRSCELVQDCALPQRCDITKCRQAAQAVGAVLRWRGKVTRPQRPEATAATVHIHAQVRHGRGQQVAASFPHDQCDCDGWLNNAHDGASWLHERSGDERHCEAATQGPVRCVIAQACAAVSRCTGAHAVLCRWSSRASVVRTLPALSRLRQDAQLCRSMHRILVLFAFQLRVQALSYFWPRRAASATAAASHRVHM